MTKAFSWTQNDLQSLLRRLDLQASLQACGERAALDIQQGLEAEGSETHADVSFQSVTQGRITLRTSGGIPAASAVTTADNLSERTGDD